MLQPSVLLSLRANPPLRCSALPSAIMAMIPLDRVANLVVKTIATPTRKRRFRCTKPKDHANIMALTPSMPLPSAKIPLCLAVSAVPSRLLLLVSPKSLQRCSPLFSSREYLGLPPRSREPRSVRTPATQVTSIAAVAVSTAHGSTLEVLVLPILQIVSTRTPVLCVAHISLPGLGFHLRWLVTAVSRLVAPLGLTKPVASIVALGIAAKTTLVVTLLLPSPVCHGLLSPSTRLVTVADAVVAPRIAVDATSSTLLTPNVMPNLFRAHPRVPLLVCASPHLCGRVALRAPARLDRTPKVNLLQRPNPPTPLNPRPIVTLFTPLPLRIGM